MQVRSSSGVKSHSKGIQSPLSCKCLTGLVRGRVPWTFDSPQDEASLSQCQDPGAQLRLKDRVGICPLPRLFLLPVYISKEDNVQRGLCRRG